MTTFFGRPTSPGVRMPLEIDLPAEPLELVLSEGVSVPPDIESGPYIDHGMPIPDSYGVDVVRALVQDPFHLMVYWELGRESLAALSGLFPDAPAGSFRPTMRLTDVDEGFEAYVSIPLTGKYWFGTTPNRRYRVDIGARSPQFGFVPIVRSNTVETPRGTVAAEADPDPEYQVDTPRFVSLLKVTGFATDRVLEEVARADAHHTPVPEEAPAYLADAFAHMPASVRAAAANVADGGTLSEGDIDRFPERLKSALTGLRRDGEVLTAAFMHLLPQMLRQALEGQFVLDSAHPFHLSPRYAAGSSDLVQRPHVNWKWMPSMVESLGKTIPAIEPDPLDSTE